MKKFIKGVIIGLVNVIPGVCSATTAIFLGVYDEVLAITSAGIKFKKYFLHKWLILGIGLGVILALLVVKKIYLLFPGFTLLFFWGLNLGGLIRAFKKINYQNIIINILGLGLVISTLLLKTQDLETIKISFLIIGGGLVAFAFIMPGISGSMMLLALGIYFKLIDVFFVTFRQIVNKTIPDLDNLVIIGVFLSSFMICLVLTSLVIKRVKDSHQGFFDHLTQGMIIGSIGLMMIEVNREISQLTFNFLNVVMALLVFTVGVMVLGIRKSDQKNN